MKVTDKPSTPEPGTEVRDNPDRRPIDPTAIFGDDRPIWLEVGFGGGEHMVHMAARYPASNT